MTGTTVPAVPCGAKRVDRHDHGGAGVSGPACVTDPLEDAGLHNISTPVDTDHVLSRWVRRFKSPHGHALELAAPHVQPKRGEPRRISARDQGSYIGDEVEPQDIHHHADGPEHPRREAGNH